MSTENANMNDNVGKRPLVDIIVPLYRNLALSRRCVDSVLAHTDMSRARLVLINDASPEPELAEWHASLEGREDTVLLTHEQNRGFVVSVNAGMTMHESHDVVLLNSDTEVPMGWLDRLASTVYSAQDIATATPFSNNGSICSYPHFCFSAALPAGLDLAALDALFAQANRGRVENLPTAVGFCMYVRRSALQRCGLFDAERFGRGYGEENDFSLRAAAAGLRNVLCGDLFVYHEGGASFGDARKELMENAERVLVERHPHYPQLVSRFVAEDPLHPLRDAVDDLRLSIKGQPGELLGEWRASRDALVTQRQASEGLLQDYHRRCDDYARLLDELRTAVADQERTYEEKCARYETLLSETRTAFDATDKALAEQQQQFRDVWNDLQKLTQQHEQTQIQLNTAEQQLARLNKLPIIRLGRWLKRSVSRP